jgi:glycosyltransferase involved in cell wall biosynthesis
MRARVLLVPGLGIVPSAGGQGSFCRYLATALRARGVEIVIGSGHAEWQRLGAAEAISVESEPRYGAFDLIHFNANNRSGLARALPTGRPIVVTHQDYHAVCPEGAAYDPRGCSAGPELGPCVNCPRRDLRARAGLYAFRAMALWPRVHHVAISDCVRRRLGLPRAAAVLSPQPPLPPPAGPVEAGLLAFAGRLVPHKGVQLVVRALAELPGARLEVAGEGPGRLELEALAAASGVADRVRFLGMLSLAEVQALYGRAAAVVVPSLYDEPFGYSAAEAMALGKATVATRAGAFVEMLSDERGWLCSTTDVADWVRTLREVLANPGERERRGAAALAFTARVLSPAHVAERYEAVYRQATGASR